MTEAMLQSPSGIMNYSINGVATIHLKKFSFMLSYIVGILCNYKTKKNLPHYYKHTHTQIYSSLIKP